MKAVTRKGEGMECPILLMTGCVNPMGMSATALQDADVRRGQYLKAIGYYLEETPFRIVFVENSGTDLSAYFPEAVAQGRLEFITYQGNGFDRRLGKGYGECITIRTALERSEMIEENIPVIKVSGRHIVRNVVAIWRRSKWLVRSASYVVCDVNRRTRGANSDLFIATPDFYRRLAGNLDLIDESKGVWMEHALYETIAAFCQEGGEFAYLPMPLHQEGQSGSMGTWFEKAPLKTYLQHAVKACLYRLGLYRIH